MGNAYLDKKEAERKASVDTALKIGQRLGRQIAIDSFQLAMGRYEKLDLGYKRIMEITNLAEKIWHEYAEAFHTGPEADVYQDRMDREMTAIIRGNAELIPFNERYPELKEQIYEVPTKAKRKKRRN